MHMLVLVVGGAGEMLDFLIEIKKADHVWMHEYFRGYYIIYAFMEDKNSLGAMKRSTVL